MCAVADSVRDFLRAGDVLGRVAGVELVLLQPETGQQDALAVVGRLRDRLRELAASRNWPASLSIGLVTCTVAPGSADEALLSADRLMCRVKVSGGDGARHNVPGPLNGCSGAGGRTTCGVGIGRPTE